jgi:trigger factor
MKVSTEQKENRQVELTIEADPDEMENAIGNAVRRLAGKVNVPGFRKGKAPRQVFEQYVGRDALVDEAIERLVSELYTQAAKEQGLEAIAAPAVEVIQREPLAFKALVPLAPQVELGKYRGIGLDMPSADIRAEDLETALNQIRQEHAVLTPVERPVELGDVVTLDVSAAIDGKPFLDHKDINYEVNPESRVPLPGFSEELLGLRKNEEKEFALQVPEDHYMKDLAGKTCQCHATVKEVKKKELPNLDDELAKAAGYEDLASLREKVASDLEKRARESRDRELRQKALEALVERSSIEYPPVLENREIESILGEQARRFGYTDVDEYLNRVNTTKEQVWEELRPVARKRIANSLVLDRLARENKIEISASDVDNRVQEMVRESSDREKAERFLKLPQVRESIESSLRTDRALDHLVRATTGADAGEASDMALEEEDNARAEGE